MSAQLTSLHRCCQRSAHLLAARRSWSSSPQSPPVALHARLLLYLTQRFYDVEMFMHWRVKQRWKAMQRKNANYNFTKRHYGSDIAAAYFILCLKGGFRCVGHSDWFHGERGKFNRNFMNLVKTPLEEVDLSYTPINCTGLENLMSQRSLRTLSFRGCPEVDDWCLARLHIFQDSLEELDISHCPRITTGGLAALRNLKGLRRLNMSSLPGITSPALLIILMEEMLPQCEVTATGYDLSLSLDREEERQ